MSSEVFPEVEYCASLLRGIVDYPEAIKIARKVDDLGILLTVEVAAGDAGRVIGKEGKTANAIRSLVRVMGMRTNSRVSIKISDPRTADVPFSA